MSAVILRRAAALIRERAEAVEGWYSAPAWSTTAPMNLPIEKADAAHIASWHPAVALAVARWLEAESHVPEQDIGDGITVGGPSLEALDLARAYLGADA
jgi:hypothetical protein